LYYSKLENQEEIDKFHDKYDSLKLKQENLNNINISIASNMLETVIKNFPKTKCLGSYGFTPKFNPTFKEPTPMFFKLVQKVDREI
jgi:hypothetical protein